MLFFQFAMKYQLIILLLLLHVAISCGGGSTNPTQEQLFNTELQSTNPKSIYESTDFENIMSEAKNMKVIWESQGITDYSYEYHTSSWAFNDLVKINVKEGKVDSVYRKSLNDKDSVFELQQTGGGRTISELIDGVIQTAKTPWTVNVSYDSNYGFPLIISTGTTDISIADAGSYLKVLNVTK